MNMAVFLGKSHAFPSPETANSDGLVAVGGDLSVERLLVAYRAGIFPWSARPVTWWSPDPRAIIELDGFHVSRSLSRTLRRRPFEVTFDRAFERVIRACAEPGPRREETWIGPDFIRAYTELHRCGHAHSVECWLGDRLAGGVYGVALGAFFAGESMFHRERDASKVALATLVGRLRQNGFELFDIQTITPATVNLGARLVLRSHYLQRLEHAVAQPDRWGEPTPMVGRG